MFSPSFRRSAAASWLTGIALIIAALWATLASRAAWASDGFLDPQDAFQFSSLEKPGTVELHFRIADGYYLYRERFAFAVRSGDAALGVPQLPPGKVKFDQTFNKDVETYRGNLVVTVPITRTGGAFDLIVTSQGCADQGICYPPAEHVVHLSGPAVKAGVAGATTTGGGNARSGPLIERFFSADDAQAVLQQDGLSAVLAFFFAGGIVLSLFPCSLPMIPILSSIIVGQGAHVTRARGCTLSVAYVLGMALVYALLGVAAAAIGQSLGAWLQNRWVLGVFAILIAGMGGLLLAGRDIQLPQGLQDRANALSQRQAGGRFAAVFVMGALSAVVVGACMTAPLAAILLFIAHTGNIGVGAASLFAMGLGNGVPLLVVGIGAGALLPRAGRWMDAVKRIFGMMLLAVALWLVTPVLPGTISMSLAALWLMVTAALLRLFDRSAGTASIAARLSKGLAAALAVWAVALLVGVAAGSSDPLRPLAVLAGARTGPGTAATIAATVPAFAPVTSTAQLDQVLGAAQRPVMLDFYADWCTSCKEMEQFTFSDERVRTRLASMDLLRADVTANHADNQALLRRFRLFGPPGIVFFDAQGRELARFVGYQSPELFLKSLDRLIGTSSPVAG
ncbi:MULTISPECIES: protein-disulfide reductase DsbD [Mycetohabitans]|uniref:protein-disulfide reductase DsbD n=1 Tax=Mycetohabitans TaxID=2571159 RepID=UPI001F34F8B1|nr:protein-disulfide reductase DsbD [Mycetohabitans sp. B3]MCF2133344.1 protein-disulfide reductase DsbD [Mycetohabitans sp. B3]